MINSMWSGVSGLQVQQNELDVIGNDIANVNTVGFKQSNVSFLDTFYQTLDTPTQGTSGKQIGMGVSLGRIAQDFTDGTMKQTGVPSDLAISGNGFFVLKDASGQNTTYTRAGDFQLSYDSSADTLSLMGPDGKYLYGTSGGTAGTASTQITLPSDVQDISISSKGVLSYVDGTGATVADAYNVDIATFPGEHGLKQVGSSQYAETAASGAPNFTSTDHEVMQGYLENSNVDLAKEFTEMIVAQRGFQANSRTVTTADSVLQELLNLKR